MKKLTFNGIFKTTGSLTGMIAVLVIVIAINIMIRQVNIRIDLTEEKIYSLSEGTKNLLGDLDKKITLQFFSNSSLRETPIPLKNFSRQVEDLLKEYRIASKGYIKIEKYEPFPDSDAEEWAQKHGLSAQPSGTTGIALYCGIVGVSGVDEVVMPLLNPVREGQLEYDITRMIAQLVNPEPPVVGVISSLPVFGSTDFPFGRPGQPLPTKKDPWLTFADIQKDYDIRTIEPDADVVPDEINALIIVHPKGLSAKTQYAIDQFLLRGGRILAFLDPWCIVDEKSGRHQPMTKFSSNMEQLLAAWGVTFDVHTIVADLNATTRMFGRDNRVEENIILLSLRENNFDSSDILTGSIKALLMAYAGSFSFDKSENIKIKPLVRSSKEAGLIEVTSARSGADAIKHVFKSENKEQNLAIRLHGIFETAFSEGNPENKEEAEKTAHLDISAEPGSVILVGDVDMLFDQFCVQESEIMGSGAFQPINDNIVFFANAVEQICGSEDLISIRSRGTVQRPFTKVLELQKNAQIKWLEEERLLEKKLHDLQTRLSKMQQAGGAQSQRFILNPQKEQEIKRFKEEESKTRGRLKEVRRNLRRDIERLGVKVKTINILFAPVLTALAGIAFGIYRKTRYSRKARAVQ